MMYYNAQIEIYDVINGGGDMFVCAADAVFVCQCGGLAAAIQLGLGGGLDERSTTGRLRGV